jgi:hypothetical protein
MNLQPPVFGTMPRHRQVPMGTHEEITSKTWFRDFVARLAINGSRSLEPWTAPTVRSFLSAHMSFTPRHEAEIQMTYPTGNMVFV